MKFCAVALFFDALSVPKCKWIILFDARFLHSINDMMSGYGVSSIDELLKAIDEDKPKK